MSTDTLKKMTIQTRNHLILQDFQQLTEKEPKQSPKMILNTISQKYDISFSNAKNLYYTKFKPMLSDEETEHLKTETTEEKAVWKENITMNGVAVRVFTCKEDTYLVAKDMLLSCGIKSQSSYLNKLTNEENRLYVPVLSTQGLFPTRIIRLDVCLHFLSTVAENHHFASIKTYAQENYETLKRYSETLNVVSDIQVTEAVETYPEDSENVTLSITESTTEEINYKIGDEVDFTVTYIGNKNVSGLTNDKHAMPTHIYIADVTDKYIQNIRDYFKPGETVRATVKFYDKDRKKLNVTTRLSQILAIKNQIEEAAKKTATPETSPQALKLPIPTENVRLPVVAKETLSIDTQGEFEAILHLINREARIGALTPQAKSKLILLLNEKGIVNVLGGIKQAADSFQPDLGLAFLDDVEKKLNKEYL